MITGTKTARMALPRDRALSGSLLTPPQERRPSARQAPARVKGVPSSPGVALLVRSVLRRSARELRELRKSIIDGNCLLDDKMRPRLETMYGDAKRDARRLKRLLDDLKECLR